MESNERSAPKQVIVMRRDLGMRRGKEIAQGSNVIEPEEQLRADPESDWSRRA